MKIQLSLLAGLAGYFVWATSLADTTAGIVSAIGL